MNKTRVTALVGAQFGSEGKGLIAEKIATQYGVHVRTGAPNAGHTYYIDGPVVCSICGIDHDRDESAMCEDGEATSSRIKVVARSVPVGASNPNALLLIGPGGLIDLDLLVNEVKELDALGLHVSERLIIDERAMIIDPVRHHNFEGGVDGYAHQAIGSTGEGVGPARMAKIARGTMTTPKQGPAWLNIAQVGEWADVLEDAGISIGDTAAILNEQIDQGVPVLLEGTQGSGLSLVHGPWPFCTSSDTNAAQLAVDAGVAPQLITDVILVARSFPIRVAGNSGPLPQETTFEALGQPEERTTVTKKVRRIGIWTDELVRRAIMLNRPTEIALTFGDYLDKSAHGCTMWDALPTGLRDYVADLEERLGVHVNMIGTGPDTIVNNPGWGRTSRSARFINRDQPVREPLPWPTWREAYGC